MNENDTLAKRVKAFAEGGREDAHELLADVWRGLADEQVEATDRQADAVALVAKVNAAIDAGEDWRSRIRADASFARRLDAMCEPRPKARAVPDITENPPTRLLALSEGGRAMKGALLSAGGVCLLAGEGGVGKSAYAAAVALGVAHSVVMVDGKPVGKWGSLGDGLLHGEGGPALVATWEDALPVTARRLRQLAELRGGGDWDRALHRVHLLDLAGRPLYGPSESYNARPVQLSGWRTLWGEAERAGAKLIVIDPATSAYCGVGHGVAEVREFMQTLGIEAAARGVGVLLVAHSTKEGRARSPLDPGKVAGSAAWTDAARGVLTLSWGEGERVLGVSKANHGPSRLIADVEAVKHKHGGVVGLKGDGWNPPSDADGDGGDPFAGVERP